MALKHGKKDAQLHSQDTSMKLHWDTTFHLSYWERSRSVTARRAGKATGEPRALTRILLQPPGRDA